MKKNSTYLPTLFFEHVTPSAIPRHIFILLNRYGWPKNESKLLKISPILFNFNQFNNCPFFLGNYFLLYLVVWRRKAAKWSHNFFWSVCLVMRSPPLLLKSWFQYMDPVCPKNLWVRHCYLQHIFLLNC